MRSLPGTAVLALALTACDGSAAVPATVPAAPAPATPTVATTIAVPPAPVTTWPAVTSAPGSDLDSLARGVMLVGVAGRTLDASTASHLMRGGAGVVLFDRNVGDAGQLSALTTEVSCAAGRPVLVAIDQEVGPIARLGDLVTPLPTAEEASQMNLDQLYFIGNALGDEMTALGINMDLAPVIDVVTGLNPVLEGRALGGDPELVAELGTAFADGLADAGVVAVPKHFPGHGRSTTDPHDVTTRIDATADELDEVDWVPFREAIAAGVPAVMLGHPIYESIDPDLPASLSPAVLDLLRTEFGFDGVAVTDSLSMAAVLKGRGPGLVAVLAIAAGEDLLLVEDPSQIQPMVTALVAAVLDGELPRERLAEAAGRVEALAAGAAPVACT